MIAPCGGLKFKDGDFKVENGEIALNQEMMTLETKNTKSVMSHSKKMPYMSPFKSGSVSELEKYINQLRSHLIECGYMESK